MRWRAAWKLPPWSRSARAWTLSFADSLNLINLWILFSVMSTAPLLCISVSIYNNLADAIARDEKSPHYEGFYDGYDVVVFIECDQP